MRKARQAGAVATVTALGVFTRLIAFLFKVYLSRRLGAEALGLYQIALSVFLLFASLSSSGVPLILSRKVAENDALGKKNDYSLFTAALLWALPLSLVIVVALLLAGENIGFFFSDPLALPLFFIMLPAIVSTAVYCVVRGFFWGKKMFAAFSFTETLEEILKIVFSLLFLGGVFGIVSGAKAICYAFTVSDMIVAVVLLIVYFLKGGNLHKPAPLKTIVLPSLPVTAMRVSASVFATLLALLLPMRLIDSGLTTAEATEAFGRVTGMANPLLFVPLTVTGSIAVVLLPDISALAVKNDYTTLNKRVDLGMNFSFLICGLVMGLFLSLGEELTSFLYGDTESGKYLSVAAFSMLPMCLSQMSQSILNSVGKEKQAFFSFLAGNACMLVLIYVLPKYVGIYGMAIATCASYLVDGTINCVLLHKKTGWGRNAIIYLVLSVLFSLICAFFTLSLRSLTGALAPFLSLFIKGFFCVVSYATLCAGAGLIDINLFWALCKKKKAR